MLEISISLVATVFAGLAAFFAYRIPVVCVKMSYDLSQKEAIRRELAELIGRLIENTICYNGACRRIRHVRELSKSNTPLVSMLDDTSTLEEMYAANSNDLMLVIAYMERSSQAENEMVVRASMIVSDATRLEMLLGNEENKITLGAKRIVVLGSDAAQIKNENTEQNEAALKAHTKEFQSKLREIYQSHQLSSPT